MGNQVLVTFLWIRSQTGAEARAVRTAGPVSGADTKECATVKTGLSRGPEGAAAFRSVAQVNVVLQVHILGGDAAKRESRSSTAA